MLHESLRLQAEDQIKLDIDWHLVQILNSLNHIGQELDTMVGVVLDNVALEALFVLGVVLDEAAVELGLHHGERVVVH